MLLFVYDGHTDVSILVFGNTHVLYSTLQGYLEWVYLANLPRSSLIYKKVGTLKKYIHM